MKPAFIYFAISGEDKVLAGVVDPASGAIELRHEIAVPGGPEMLAIDPARRFLFVGCHHRNAPKDAPTSGSKLYSFRIDPRTGGLTPIHNVSLPFAPTYLAVDRKGGFLLSAYYRSGKAAVHRLTEQGEIGEATQWFDTGGGAHCIQVDPTNRYVFLPHISSSKVNKDTWPPLLSPNHILPSAANMILQFKFAEDQGTLSPNSPFKLPGERGGGPRHFCFHPQLDCLYFSNEQGCAVTVYALNPADGALTFRQFISTLPPEGYDSYASCSTIRISHSGRFLFVLNRGYDSVACFTVDPATGKLKANGIVPTEPQPHEMEIVPDDRFLYVAGYESGRLATYRVGDDGRLTQLDSRPLGRKPKTILAITQEA